MRKKNRLSLTAAAVVLLIGLGGFLMARYTMRARSPEYQARRVVEKWSEAVQKGESGKMFWEDRELADTMFAVRSCKILYVNKSDDDNVTICARIESSTRGGLPIVADWFFFLRNSSGGWKIIIVTEAV